MARAGVQRRHRVCGRLDPRIARRLPLSSNHVLPIAWRGPRLSGPMVSSFMKSLTVQRPPAARDRRDRPVRGSPLAEATISACRQGGAVALGGTRMNGNIMAATLLRDLRDQAGYKVRGVKGVALSGDAWLNANESPSVSPVDAAAGALRRPRSTAAGNCAMHWQSSCIGVDAAQLLPPVQRRRYRPLLRAFCVPGRAPSSSRRRGVRHVRVCARLHGARGSTCRRRTWTAVGAAISPPWLMASRGANPRLPVIPAIPLAKLSCGRARSNVSRNACAARCWSCRRCRAEFKLIRCRCVVGRQRHPSSRTLSKAIRAGWRAIGGICSRRRN